MQAWAISVQIKTRYFSMHKLVNLDELTESEQNVHIKGQGCDLC